VTAGALVSPITRISLFVRDLEASLAFYRDLLELKVVADKQVAGPGAARLMGLDDCSLRVVYLQSEGNEFGMVGLFEVQEPPLPTAPVPSQPAMLGRAVVGFATTDAGGLAGRLRAANAEFLVDPVDYANPALGEFVEMLVADPDGVALSFVEFRPARPGLSRSWYGDIDER
jgi:catechol 2,3-dioxygenase-like lactoylglutathione lyase family enzyme